MFRLIHLMIFIYLCNDHPKQDRMFPLLHKVPSLAMTPRMTHFLTSIITG